MKKKGEFTPRKKNNMASTVENRRHPVTFWEVSFFFLSSFFFFLSSMNYSSLSWFSSLWKKQIQIQWFATTGVSLKKKNTFRTYYKIYLQYIKIFWYSPKSFLKYSVIIYNTTSQSLDCPYHTVYLNNASSDWWNMCSAWMNGPLIHLPRIWGIVFSTDIVHFNVTVLH